MILFPFHRTTVFVTAAALLLVLMFVWWYFAHDARSIGVNDFAQDEVTREVMSSIMSDYRAQKPASAPWRPEDLPHYEVDITGLLNQASGYRQHRFEPSTLVFKGPHTGRIIYEPSGTTVIHRNKESLLISWMPDSGSNYRSQWDDALERIRKMGVRWGADKEWDEQLNAVAVDPSANQKSHHNLRSRLSVSSSLHVELRSFGESDKYWVINPSLYIEESQ